MRRPCLELESFSMKSTDVPVPYRISYRLVNSDGVTGRWKRSDIRMHRNWQELYNLLYVYSNSSITIKVFQGKGGGVEYRKTWRGTKP